MPARSAECQCDPSFTCGFCLRNAKPYHFTPSTAQEQIARQIAREADRCPHCDVLSPAGALRCTHCATSLVNPQE